MVEMLERRRESGHLIVETGCLRNAASWDGDGQSTAIFDRFATLHGGSVVSVDINANHCATAREAVSSRTTVICQESVEFLFRWVPPRCVDLLYLDSYDLDWGNPHPSSLHHMKELCAILPKLGAGTLIVVDDNANGRGKGEYIQSFMDAVGIEPAFSEYQIGWVLP
jgi:hypothetical protein